MNREKIIQMAIDCGMEDIHLDGGLFYAGPDDIERFYAAIRAATKEEDANICEDLMQIEEGPGPDYASAIRAS